MLDEIRDEENKIQAAIDHATFNNESDERLRELNYALARISFHRETVLYNVERILKKQGKMSNDNRECNEDSDEDDIKTVNNNLNKIIKISEILFEKNCINLLVFFLSTCNTTTSSASN